MNKLSVFIVVVLGLFNTVVAQQPKSNDSTEVYEYWAHRGIIEMVYAYMKDYVGAVGEVKVKKPELDGLNKFGENFIININNERLPDFNTVSSFLNSNNWQGAATTILQPLIKNLKDTIPLNSHFFLDATRNISKNSNNSILVPIDYIPSENNDINKRVFWNKKIEEIVKSYQKNLVGPSQWNEGVKEAEELQTPSVVQNNYKPEKNYSFSNPNWIKLLIYSMLFLFGLVVGGFLVFYISKTKIYSILSLEKDKYLYDIKMDDKSFIFKYIGLFYILKKSKDNYKNKNETLIEKHKILNKKEEFTRSQFDRFKAGNQETLSQTKEIKYSQIEDLVTKEWDNIQPQEKSKNKLFFSMPESDGRFIVNNGETLNDGRKYYKIEYQESSEEGELYFVSSERDKRAINRLESYLKPVCDIENIINADMATRIDFISPGKVVLMNDSWVIDSDKKVKIKLL